jgi:hypothetical protein
MSNHIHLIASDEKGFSLLSIIRDCKKFTAKAIVDSLQNEPESRASWLESIIRAHGTLNTETKNTSSGNKETGQLNLLIYAGFIKNSHIST